MKKKKIEKNSTSILARQDDGTIQLTITIPQSLVQQKKEQALIHLVQSLEVPGFRRGKAPRDVALKHIEKQELYNHLLQDLLPAVYTASVEKHKVTPILAPRFELINTDDDRDWQVRAVTCELPTINIEDYRKAVKGRAAASKIWVPEKQKNGPVSREEKEQQVLKTILETAQAQIPRLLLEEEVNHRLAKLLDQTQKLGLTVEQYLASTGKTTESLRAEFAQQAENSIKLELALNKIADEEKVTVDNSEITALINASGDEEVKKSLANPAQRRMIHGVLKRRKALDRLVALV